MDVLTSDTFTRTCPCGVEYQVVKGWTEAHACRPITPQMVRDAWADGYEFAKLEG